KPGVGTVSVERPRKGRRFSLLALAAVLVSAVVYVILAAFGGSGHQSAFAAANCTLTANGTGQTANIALDPTASTTLGQDSANSLLVAGNPCQNGVFNFNPAAGSAGPITVINFTQQPAPPPNSGLSIVLDQTQPGGVFPCTAAISGNISG